MNRSEQIQALRDIIKDLENIDRKEADLRRRETPIQYRYFLELTDPSSFDKIYDDTVCWYRLGAECVNKEEALEAGHPKDRVNEITGMNYLYNSASGRFVMSSGGGTVHLGFADTAEQRAVIAEALEFFADVVKENPWGADVTDYMTVYKTTRKKIGGRW